MLKFKCLTFGVKKIFVFLVALLVPSLTFAQLPPHLVGLMEYPVFEFHPMIGVVKTKTKELKYDKSLSYKMAIDVSDGVKDSSKIIRPFLEVARSYNLNVANGVPKRKLEAAVVIHGAAIWAILKNDAFKEKYGVDNPNLEAIRIMKKQGIEFYVCSQVLAFRNVSFDQISDEIDLVVSAKTALITLDQMGYSYLNVNEK